MKIRPVNLLFSSYSESVYAHSVSRIACSSLTLYCNNNYISYVIVVIFISTAFSFPFHVNEEKTFLTLSLLAAQTSSS